MVRLVEWRRSHRFTESEVERYGISPDFLVDWGSSDPYGRYLAYVSTLDRPRRVYEYLRFMSGFGGWAKLEEWLGKPVNYNKLDCADQYRHHLGRFFFELVEHEPADLLVELDELYTKRRGRQQVMLGMPLNMVLALHHGPGLGDLGKKLARLHENSYWLALYEPSEKRIGSLEANFSAKVGRLLQDQPHLRKGYFLFPDLEIAGYLGDPRFLDSIDKIESFVKEKNRPVCYRGREVPQAELVREPIERYRENLGKR